MKLLNLTAALFLGGVLQAQNPLPAIHPQPQEVTLSTNRLKAPHGFTLSGMQHPDEDAMRLIRQTLSITDNSEALPLKITSLEDRTPELKRSGAYLLVITPEEIDIAISDSRGLFYAAQTLQQLAQTDGQGNTTLPLGVIKDYPDVAYRGTVEGFYGDPWSHTDRIEQLRFYGKMKMNTYIYGPKDDPYHSSPNWRKPYPEKEAAQIKDLVKEAAANKVDFVWAIHPGLDIKWTDEDRMNVLNKFGMMYDLGVRSFAVFFDDISGEGAKADKQADLLNFLQKEFIEKKEGVSPLIMCPTEYNRAWAGSDYLDVLGRTLDPAIHVMWTGNSVIHDITLEGQEWVNKRIQRPSYVWWNFPVSDYCRDHLLMGPSYGLDPNAAHAMSGFVANPMERAEASKVALYGVADYAWNMKAYNPESDFAEACRYVLPEAPEAFRTFCENNCDPGPNGHRYRRDESIRYAESAEAFLHDFRQHNYNADAADRMNRLFAEITAAPAAIETSRNKALIDEIKPWLMQFHLLGKAGQKAIRTAETGQGEDRAATWQSYLSLTSLLDSMRTIDRTYNQNPYQKGVKVGSRVLTPFVQEIHSGVGSNLLFADQTDAATQMSKASILTDIEQLKYQPLKEGKDQIGYNRLNEVLRIEPGQSFGLTWELQKEATSFNFSLPKSENSGRVFEWSADGRQWTTIADIPADQARFKLEKLAPGARYIRMRNATDKQKQIYLYEFAVTTKEDTSIDPVRLMYDKNLESVNTLTAGSRITIDKEKNGSLELYLSGSPCSQVVVEGAPLKGKVKQVLYSGPANYIKLKKEALESVKALELYNAGSSPVNIHEIN